MDYIQLKTFSLKNQPKYNENWLQEAIASDPTILGIGDVIVRDKERLQPNAGRLDLLLQEAEGYGRFEVEIQLGATDESHIIRTIEYWDIERRRYPQYDHTAVIVAEDINSRFLNVISLFNGFIPIMALQLTAIKTSDGIGLHFTKVLDTVRLGFIEDDEETAEPTDRNYWETKRGTPKTVKLADEILNIVKEFAPQCEQSYNKYYIGFKIDNKPFNFAICKPQKSGLRLEAILPKNEELDQKFENAGVDVLDYDSRGKRYKIRLQEQSIQKHRELIKDLLEQAYERKT